jgi:hypothetical protein
VFSVDSITHACLVCGLGYKWVPADNPITLCLVCKGDVVSMEKFLANRRRAPETGDSTAHHSQPEATQLSEQTKGGV